MANDIRTNLLVIIEGNDFLELKGFLKHDHFACKPTQFNLTNQMKHFEVQSFKTMKRKKKKKKLF